MPSGELQGGLFIPLPAIHDQDPVSAPGLIHATLNFLFLPDVRYSRKKVKMPFRQSKGQLMYVEKSGRSVVADCNAEI